MRDIYARGEISILPITTAPDNLYFSLKDESPFEGGYGAFETAAAAALPPEGGHALSCAGVWPWRARRVTIYLEEMQPDGVGRAELSV